jgi:hypothetical protein
MGVGVAAAVGASVSVGDPLLTGRHADVRSAKAAASIQKKRMGIFLL